MWRGHGGCNRGCQKIYVAFTVEQVVKCNYRGGRHTAEPQPSRQTGRKARRQVIKAYSSSLSLHLSLVLYFFCCLPLCCSRPINQLHQVQASVVKTAQPFDLQRCIGNIKVRLTDLRLHKKTPTEQSNSLPDDAVNLSSYFTLFVTMNGRFYVRLRRFNALLLKNEPLPVRHTIQTHQCNYGTKVVQRR